MLRHLTEATAAFRILSIHYGYEGKVRADELQLKQWRGEAARAGVDLVIGHHAHVVRGVEMSGRTLIFYGLANFLHHGTANMTHNPLCKDAGLMGRVHLRRTGETVEIRAVEAIPVTDTHVHPRRLAVAQSVAHVHALNYLAGLLDDPNGTARGLRFTPQKDGSGLYCVPGADKDGGATGALCRDFAPAPPVPAVRRARMRSADRPQGPARARRAVLPTTICAAGVPGLPSGIEQTTRRGDRRLARVR